MPENTAVPADGEQDPGANTQMFRAFVEEGKSEIETPPKVSGRTLAIAAGVIVVLAIVAAILVF